jgi:uncharacterized protein YfaS (alpha-2-macroglobulin family)
MTRFASPVYRWLLLVLLFALLLPFTPQSRASKQLQRISRSDGQEGLRFRLSEGAETQEPPPPRPRPSAAPLSEADTQKLLARLQPIKAEASDEQEFALRDRSLPPPRTGQTIAAAFPPVESAVAPDQTPSGPLEILRFAPEGDVPLAPHLSITFSQPMVPVTSNSDLAARDVPVKLTPQPTGKWRWVGTKTLLFEPEGRFPAATSYTVEVPAGTKSATGAALATSKRWGFTTPPPQVKSSYPNGGPHSRHPLFFIEFDQRIKPESVLSNLRLQAHNRQWKLRLATAEEVEADEQVRRMAKAAERDRWLALRAVAPAGAEADKPLLAGTTYTVSIGPGTPSAEGPRTTAAAQTFSFSTHGPLQLTDHECGDQGNCEPFAPWSLQFNNELDSKAFEQNQIRVKPELPGMKTEVWGDTIEITGPTRGRTTYQVTLSAAIRDQFGQTLGEDKTVIFKVGSALPAVAASGEGLVVLDPNGPPRFSIYSINHQQLKVSLYAVSPEHWGQFAAFMRGENQDQRRRHENPPMPPIGRLIFSKIINVAARPDEMVETPIDLRPALDGGFGHAVLSVEAVQPPRREWERRSVHAWIQVTHIGLDAFIDPTELLGWATSLKDGKPLGDVQMMIASEEQPGVARADDGTKTGNDGLVRVALPSNYGRKLLIARRGKDIAILPESFSWWGGSGSNWHRKGVLDALRWHVFDDRGMYRPGEEVHIKGWLRKIGGGPKGDVGTASGAVTSVSYALKDMRGNEVLKGSARVNAIGGFDTAFRLPPVMNLGYATLTLKAEGEGWTIGGREHSHQLRVQEFRRPEYEVKTTANEGPHFVGSHADVSVMAAYYAGGGLQNAEVLWRVTATPTNYTPPNRGDFTFGKWRPWWDDSSPESDDGSRDESGDSQSFSGRTDATGKHRLRIDLDSVNPLRPTAITAQASVTDVNRQNLSGSVNLLVHPAAVYVGLRSARTFVQQGEPLVVQSIVTDLDGRGLASREIKMRAVLLDWTFEKSEWRQQEVNPQKCVIRSGADPVACRFETKEGGVYRITATVIDDRERENQSELTLWVAGGKRPPQRNVAQEDVELIPDRKEYQAGETAEILVQAPFYPAEGVLTLRRSGMVSSERFTMTGPSHTLRVPISESYVPNLRAQVDLVGAALRTDDEGKTLDRLPKRPAFASGSLNLSIPPLKRKLAVTAIPRDKTLEPGGETVVDVELRDSAGKPVPGGEVAVVVVDEAVLALTNYQLADPLATFYNQRSSDVADHHLREKILLAKPSDLSGRLQVVGRGLGPGEGGGVRVSATPVPMQLAGQLALSTKADRVAFGGGGGIEEQSQIRARIDFNALAIFAPAVPTDANGRAMVKVKLPDNLTRYRVMAVAVAGEKQFGAIESSITARLPLMVRPSAPRFLNFGDQFELPVVVQNQTDQAMQVDLAVRAANAQLTAGAGRRITVPANDRIEVRFPATTVRPGTARFQIAAVSGRWSDAAEVSLPVWTPATTEAFAAYGEVDQGAIIQPVKAPSDAVRQFGGLEITTSSTQLQALTDAVLYLTSYPYECAEQISSRVLAVAALRDVLAAFEAKGLPAPDDLETAVARDIKRLAGLQNPDGGFGFWRRGNESWPYLSIHAAHAFERAKEKGFDAPADAIEKSRQYLRNIERHIPSYYGPEARRTLIAYALYVRQQMGERDAAKARALLAEAGGMDKLPLEAAGWLLPVLSNDPGSRAEVAAIRRHLANRAEETAGTAHFTTSYSDGAHLLLHSSRRADGVILEAMIGDDPASDLIPKLARGLLAHRKQGRWENTQENAFVLLALNRYFATYEKVTPDFMARAWLGDAYAGGHEFRGRTTERHQVNVPMKYLMEQTGPQNLILSKEGAGRLYYRIGMQYAPTSLQLQPADYGFTVTRVYEAVDKPDDVRREEDGTWRIKAGAQVRVRLTMVAPARRYHVALVDALPAGLEVLNPALAVTGRIPRDQKDSVSGPWWWQRAWQWFEHQNMRDERVEAFTSLLWEGVYNYSYVARATTPGIFIVPPPKAEEMYHPETFGRGSSARVVIE